MTYLIAQIWMFLAVASALGLLFGWMFRGGVSAARLRDVRRQLAHTQVEALDQRREATELAARAERRTASGSTADTARLESELRSARADAVRMDSELREATSAAHRYSEEADELRQRLADESGGSAPVEEVPVDTTEVDNLRIQVGELEFESEDLRRKLDDVEAARGPEALQSAQDAGPEAGAEAREAAAEAVAVPLRLRISELEAELDRVVAAPPAEIVPDVNAEANLAVKVALEDENKTLRDTLGSLESELSTRASAAGEVVNLRARVAGLQVELADAASSADTLQHQAPLDALASADGEVAAETGDPMSAEVMAEAARLRWRNGYLTSRIRFLEARKPETARSEERRVGKECRSRWSPYH